MLLARKLFLFGCFFILSESELLAAGTANYETDEMPFYAWISHRQNVSSTANSISYNAATLNKAISIQEIAAIELDRWLVSEDFHDPTAFGIFQTSGGADPTGFFQHPGVIITTAEFQRFKSRFHLRSDDGGLGEIHGSPGDRGHVPRGDQAGICRQVVIRMER